MKKRLFLIFLCILCILFLSSCKDNKDEDFYQIEYTEITLGKDNEDDANDEILDSLFDMEIENKEVIEVEDDPQDFYISNIVSAKNLFLYKSTTNLGINKIIVADINITRYYYGYYLGDCYFYKIGEGERNLKKFSDIQDNKPTLLVFVDAFCDACEGFDYDIINSIDKEKYNYYYVVPNSSIEEQKAYIIEKGGDIERTLVVLGYGTGEYSIFDEVATPCTLYFSGDSKCRIIRQFTVVTGEFIDAYLDCLDNRHFPILTNEELKNKGVKISY